MLGQTESPPHPLTLSLSKDARLPEQLQRAMAAEAEAAREARAKVREEFWFLDPEGVWVSLFPLNVICKLSFNI